MRVGDVAEIPTESSFMTDEHRQVQKTAREFAMNEVMPVAQEYDTKGFDGVTMPKHLMYDDLADLGFHGMRIPEEYGGLGMGLLAYSVVTEELSRAWMSVGSIIARTQGIPGASSDQKEHYYPQMVRGDCVKATAYTEPSGGSDSANMNTTAIKEGDEYVVNGQKMWCTNAKQADIIILYALTDPKADPIHQGISSFIVDKERGEFDLKGMTGQHIPTLGYHGMNTYQLDFNDLRIPEDCLIGAEEGHGFYYIMSLFEEARVHTAARAIGCARGALEDSLEYADQRKSFGQPIKEYQGVRFKLADMATDIEAARHLTHHVATKKDSGTRCDLEASMAKLFATERAVDICNDGIQIHGGYGYAMEYPLQRYFRDARLLTVGEGTSNIMRRVIMDRIYGE